MICTCCAVGVLIIIRCSGTQHGAHNQTWNVARVEAVGNVLPPSSPCTVRYKVRSQSYPLFTSAPRSGSRLGSAKRPGQRQTQPGVAPQPREGPASLYFS